jgi:hypothetical protein
VALVDHEGVLLDLKASLSEGKRSWGRDELLARIGRLEAERRVDESEVSRYSRLLADEVEDLIFHRALPGRDAGGTGEGRQPSSDDASRGRAAAMAGTARTSRAPQAPDEEAPCPPRSSSRSESSRVPAPS